MDPLSTLALGGIAVCHRAVADGVDLGIGILFPLARRQHDRDLLLQGVTPFRRGNEPWLVFGGAMLCVYAPIAYDALPPAFYVPVLAMFSGLFLRGIALDSHVRYRHVPGTSFQARRSDRIWDFNFAGGSLVAAICQGLILGTCVQAALDRDGHFETGLSDCLSLSGLLCAVVIVGGYALLGAGFWCCARTATREAAQVVDVMPKSAPAYPRFLAPGE